MCLFICGYNNTEVHVPILEIAERPRQRYEAINKQQSNVSVTQQFEGKEQKRQKPTSPSSEDGEACHTIHDQAFS